MKLILSLLAAWILIVLLLAKAGANNEVVKKSAIKKAKNATVLLFSCDENRNCSTGTGFVVSQDPQGSFIVTNKHVCLGSVLSAEERKLNGRVLSFRAIGIKRRDGVRSGGQIIKVGQNSDLCLIRSELKFKATLKLADKVADKERLFTFGFPNANPEINFGIYKGTRGMGHAFYSETDAQCFFGASGSAIMNTSGEVVGVIAMIRGKDEDSKCENKEDVVASLFIPLEILREFIGGK